METWEAEAIRHGEEAGFTYCDVDWDGGNNPIKLEYRGYKVLVTEYDVANLDVPALLHSFKVQVENMRDESSS